MYGLRMTRIAQRMISPRGRSASAHVRRTRPRIEALEGRLVLSSSGNTLYLQTNLVSNIQGTAEAFDPNLQDPWGISFSATSPFWVSDQASNVNGSSVTTLYKVNGTTGALNVAPPFTSFGIPLTLFLRRTTTTSSSGSLSLSSSYITFLLFFFLKVAPLVTVYARSTATHASNH